MTRKDSYTGEDPFIPVLRPLLPTADKLLPYLRRIDESRTYSNFGPLVRELEQRLTQHFRLENESVVTSSSGTAALIAAILAAAGRATPGRPYALIPSFTFVATASAVEACGYVPLLADIDPETWQLHPETALRHPAMELIGVVVPVAPLGRPVEMPEWARFRDTTGIPIAIDGAASFVGIEIDPASYTGDIPVSLSLHATKSFATGEGGCVISTNPEITRKAAKALNFGFYGSRDSQAPNINGRMSEHAAAVGHAELDGWEHKRSLMLQVAANYHAEFDSDQRLHTAPSIGASAIALLSADRDEAHRLTDRLSLSGIDFRRWYGMGLHRQTYYQDQPQDNFPVTDDIAERLIGLPFAPDLASEAISRIAATVRAAVPSPS